MNRRLSGPAGRYATSEPRQSRFTPPQIDTLEARIRGITQQLVGKMVAKREFDFVADLEI